MMLCKREYTVCMYTYIEACATFMCCFCTCRSLYTVRGDLQLLWLFYYTIINSWPVAKSLSAWLIWYLWISLGLWDVSSFSVLYVHILPCNGCQFDYHLHKVPIRLHEVFLLQRTCNCSQAIASFGLFIYYSVEFETVARTS